MAERKKAKRYPVVYSPGLVQALKGFSPVFGNPDDLYVVERFESLTKKLELVDGVMLRKGKGLTNKMKDLLREEEALIHSITRRNLDF